MTCERNTFFHPIFIEFNAFRGRSQAVHKLYTTCTPAVHRGGRVNGPCGDQKDAARRGSSLQTRGRVPELRALHGRTTWDGLCYPVTGGRPTRLRSSFVLSVKSVPQ